MSDPPRTLKLKFGKKPTQPPAEPAPAPAPEPPQPSHPKLTLKIGRKPPPESTEEPEKPKKKKPSKKRPAENAAVPEPTTVPQGPKRLKLNASKQQQVQSLRLKNKVVVSNRPVGVGYDSEASDTEIDPSIEEQFILRMLPGEDCEYLRKVINERGFDRSEFSFKPLDREGRRAVLKVRDKQYAAALVDLPCIIEGMKSWDRRGWYKSADICQMLLVLGLVSSDQEALDYPIPPEVNRLDEKTLQYPHGLAPPLRWVRKRRFRDRVSSRTIEQVEKAVEDLVAQDESSVFPPRFELVDSASLNRAEGYVQSGDYDEEDYYEQDAEGEEEMAGELEDDLAAEMEAALAGEDGDFPTAEPPQAAAESSLPPEAPTEPGEAESSGNESDESAEGADEMDDDQREQQAQLQQHREEITYLEDALAEQIKKRDAQRNQILRNKVNRNIQELKKTLDLKKVSAGIDNNDI